MRKPAFTASTQAVGLPQRPQAADGELARHSLPAVYGLCLLSTLQERGCASAEILAGTGLQRPQLEAVEGRLSVLQYGAMIANAVRLSGDPGLSFELGLGRRLTAHGYLGYALMSCSTIGEAIALGMRYLRARLPFHSLTPRIEAEIMVIEVGEAIQLGSFRQFAFEHFMVEVCQLCASLARPGPGLRALWRATEVHFDFPEPPHYARYRRRLPRVRHAQASNQLRFPRRLLDWPITTANPVTARQVITLCEQELALLRQPMPVLERARALMLSRDGRYPSLAELAERLGVSSRSLKRRLREHGSSYLCLRDEARRRDSLRLLANPALSSQRIAEAVGFDNAANFNRAFRKWTGMTPGQHRLAAGARTLDRPARTTKPAPAELGASAAEA